MANHKRQPPASRGGNGVPDQPDVAVTDVAEAPPGEGGRKGDRLEHQRSEGHEHSEAHPGRQGPQRRRISRMRKQDTDLPDSEGADRTERLHLLRRRPRGAARRLRVHAGAGLQLPARPRRHLRFAVPDSQVRPADRRHRVGADSAAQEGERYFALIKVEAVNFEIPERLANKLFFENLTPLYPQEHLQLETVAENLSGASWT